MVSSVQQLLFILSLTFSIGKHVVFGKVIRGYDDVIRKIAEVSVDAKDRPKVTVAVSNCGELELRKKPGDTLSGEYSRLIP